MNLFLFIIAGITLTLSVAALLRLRFLFLAKTISTEINDFPAIEASRYRPMQRLLRDSDFDYLAASGVSHSAIGRIRKERRAIFRNYLSLMRTDFHQLTTALSFVIVHSSTAKQELPLELLKIRFRFALAMAEVHCKLLMHAAGSNNVSLEIHRLVGALEQMQTHWQLAEFNIATA